MQSEVLSPSQVGQYYPGLTVRWLSRQRWEHGSLPYIKAGKKILYRRSDIERYLEDHTVNRGEACNDPRA